jgi:hypothetical protein
MVVRHKYSRKETKKSQKKKTKKLLDHTSNLRKENSNDFTNLNLEYPYYELIYTPTISRCNYLAFKVKNKIVSTKSGQKIIIDNWNDNLELNQLTDVFTEKCRVRCTFLNNPSPLEYWTKIKKDILAKNSKNKNDLNLKIIELREIMYKNIRLCNNFRISLVLTILKMFNAKRWLDISAGWGDRLIGAILYPSLEYYCGVDPNPCVQEGYKKILDFFFSNNKVKRNKYNLIQDGFENAKLPISKTFNLVFSSPPFFNLETYSNASSNSLLTFTTEDKWLNGFLLPSIKKASSVLEKGGHLILYQAESKKTNYIPKMLEGVAKLVPELTYKGKMFYKDVGNKSNLRDFYIWKL